jgi:formylglycine-generating enzyme required for sulfatase activity
MSHINVENSPTRIGPGTPCKLILLILMLFMVFSVAAQSDPNDWNFDDGIPDNWEAIGTCGALGDDGVVDLAPDGGQQYGYCVTRSDGPELPLPAGSSPNLPSDLFADVPGETSTGSIAQSPPFSAGPGDILRFKINYVTTDLGGIDADVAWVSLLDIIDEEDKLRLTVRSTSQADDLTGVMPRSDMPDFLQNPNVTLTPENVSMSFGPPEWAPLEDDSGFCAGVIESVQACGHSGWVEVEYTFDTETTFTLQFGVVNMEPTLDPNGFTGQDQSGIAFDSIEFIPAPQQTFLVEALVDNEEDGSVDPQEQDVIEGNRAVITVTPAIGRVRRDEVNGTCIDPDNPGSWDGNTYTTSPIFSDCNVVFFFDVIEYEVTAEVPEGNGSVCPGSVMVSEGQAVTFTLSPDPGFFRTLDVTGSCPDGEWIGTNRYQTGTVTEDCDVQFRFDAVSDLLQLDLLNLGMVFGDGQSFVIFDVTNLASEDLDPVLLSADLEPGYQFTGWNSLLSSCQVEDSEDGFGFVCGVENIPPWNCQFENESLECELGNLVQGGIASLVGIVSGPDFNPEDHMGATIGLRAEGEESAFEPFQDCPECPVMVPIPGFCFIQGSPESEPQSFDNERPQREVNVPVFAIGQTTVTFDQWDACVADGGCSHVPDDNDWGRGDRPVIDVSWEDAQEYVAWLSDRTGYDYRLPSESEWEYATRAGTTGRFNTGHCITTDQANFDGTNPALECPSGNFENQTLPVAGFAPNAFGLYDTHGNVYQWVQDCWNDSYEEAPIDGSAWMTGNCNFAVARGGSWIANGEWLRSAFRNREDRDGRFVDTGFRVTRSVSQ